jgi:chromosome partitioning protein
VSQKAKNNFMLSVSDLADFLELSVTKVNDEIKKKCGPQKLKSLVSPQVARKILSAHGYKFPHKVVSFQMLKGGVAKTTSAYNFGLRAAQWGAQVLFVDLDQQANLTFALGSGQEDVPVWLDIFEKRVSIKDAILPVEPGVDLIPSSLNNSVLDRSILNSNKNWANAIKGPLKEIKAHYDLIIIDTAPSLSAVNTAVTCASNEIILPINPDRFSLIGLKKHLEDLKDLKKEFGLKFQERVLFTRFDGRETLSAQILADCMDEYEDLLLKHYIRTSTELKSAVGTGRTIFTTNTHAKTDYDLVTKELLGFI